MPNGRDGAAPSYPVRIADEFIEGLARIWSARMLAHVKGLIGLLATDPVLGSPRVRESLVKRYGDGLRKLTVSTFVIIYRFDGETVDVLAIVYGPGVRWHPRLHKPLSAHPVSSESVYKPPAYQG